MSVCSEETEKSEGFADGAKLMSHGWEFQKGFRSVESILSNTCIRCESARKPAKDEASATATE